MNNSRNYEEIENNILKDITEFGMHIAYVESDGYCPKFGYSIGLFKLLKHPELILIGLGPEATGAILNNIKKEIEKGTHFISGINYDGYLEGFPIQFVEVKKDHYLDYLGFAGWYNNNSFDFPALQIVWPDKSGIFPWYSGFNENFRFSQPLLDRNTDFKFLEERNLGVFTTSEVLDGEIVRFVYHNEDGDWQFHSEKDPDLDKAKIVCLSDIVKMDSTLNEIYYLNYGESAERTALGGDWKVFSK